MDMYRVGNMQHANMHHTLDPISGNGTSEDPPWRFWLILPIPECKIIGITITVSAMDLLVHLFPGLYNLPTNDSWIYLDKILDLGTIAAPLQSAYSVAIRPDTPDNIHTYPFVPIIHLLVVSYCIQR